MYIKLDKKHRLNLAKLGEFLAGVAVFVGFEACIVLWFAAALYH